MTLADKDAYSKVIGVVVDFVVDVDICVEEGVGDSLVTCEGMLTVGSQSRKTL